jgi:hypothetical protein
MLVKALADDPGGMGFITDSARSPFRQAADLQESDGASTVVEIGPEKARLRPLYRCGGQWLVPLE